MTRVFVYGSLMRGFPNHRLLERSHFVGDASTEQRFTMYSLGGFPGIVDRGTQAIVGEVFEVTDATLADLDRLEGHPRFYRRTVVQLADGSTASTYLLRLRDVAHRPIVQSGSWLRYQKEIR